MKKLLMFLLVFIVAFSSVGMFGCGGTPPTTPSGDGAKPEAQYKDTEIDLVLLGKTNYTIVIPAKSEYEEEFAASEFKNIFSMSKKLLIPAYSAEFMKSNFAVTAIHAATTGRH